MVEFVCTGAGKEELRVGRKECDEAAAILSLPSPSCCTLGEEKGASLAFCITSPELHEARLDVAKSLILQEAASISQPEKAALES